MIIISKKNFFYKKNIIWFPVSLSNINLNSGIIYLRQHCLDLNNKYIIADEKFVTSIIKLNNTEKEIYAGFSKTTKYDIAKGEKLLFNFYMVDISKQKEREKATQREADISASHALASVKEEKGDESRERGGM